MRYDVAIIGAGFSGIAAGIRLAHFGKKVVILEKHSVWGGLNSFYKKGGHHFDTGLHAVTNYVRPGYKGPRLPLQRIARQLRVDLAEFELLPQTFSEIVFCERTERLRFSNEFALLESEIAARFPREVDGFRRLTAACAEYPDLSKNSPRVSSRKMLGEFLSEPLLREMLLAPVLWYGSAEENDIDFEQFIILFNSIYREGFARPKRGIRGILDVLLRRLEESGGELRRSTGVQRLLVDGDRVSKLLLEDGSEVKADVVLSSAGLVETMRLRSDLSATTHAREIGQLAFVETIWVLDRPPASFGYQPCVTFFSAGASTRWAAPSEAPVDISSGVICAPSNYEGATVSPVLRATHLALPSTWFSLPEEEYAAEKERWNLRSLKTVSAYTGSFAPRYVDSFTPRTVHYYTGKLNGAIYGSPAKLKTGATDISNLYLCGTDQGLAGIVGSMLSGINIANAYGGVRE